MFDGLFLPCFKKLLKGRLGSSVKRLPSAHGPGIEPALGSLLSEESASPSVPPSAPALSVSPK